MSVRRRCWLAGALALVGCGSEGEALRESLPPVVIPDSGQNYALELDGVDDYASTGSAAFPFARAAQTISLRARPSEQAGRRSLFTMRKDFESGVELGLEEGVLAAIRIYDGSPYVQAPEPVVPDEWVHVAYTYDGSEHRLYVDGQLVSTGDLQPNNRTPTTGWLGTFDGSRDRFGGRIDDVRIRDVALSEEEILQEATEATTPDSASLVVWFTFDEGPSARAYDRSPRGNHASLGDGVAERAPRYVLADAP